MQNEKMQITLTGENLNIREGKLPEMLPEREQNIIAISGDIHTIGNYAMVRLQDAHNSQKLDIAKTIVEVDKTNLTITVKTDPESHKGATIVGKLELSDELKMFNINKDKMYSREEFSKLVRFTRMYFADSCKHAELVAALASLKLQTTGGIEQTKNNQGSHKMVSEKQVTDKGSLPDYFVLNIPVFKGFEPLNIKVDICFQTSDVNGQVVFWLESTDINEHISAKTNEYFAAELAHYEGFFIYNK